MPWTSTSRSERPADQARYALELKGFGLIVLDRDPEPTLAPALVDVAKSIDLQAVLDRRAASYPLASDAWSGQPRPSHRSHRRGCRSEHPPGKLAALDDQVLPPDRTAIEPASRISLAPAAYLTWAERLEPAICGVIPWWGIVRHGRSSGAGCGNHTSPHEELEVAAPEPLSSQQALVTSTAAKAVVAIARSSQRGPCAREGSRYPP